MKRCFLVVAWLLILLLFSCASRQRGVQKQQHEAKFEAQQEQFLASQTQLAQRYWQNDSTLISEQVLIYPDGAIQFGPEGFAGKAKAVILLRQQDQKRHASTSVDLSTVTQQHEAQQVHGEVKATEKAVQNKTQRWLSLGAIVVVLLLALAYGYWRRR